MLEQTQFMCYFSVHSTHFIIYKSVNPSSGATVPLGPPGYWPPIGFHVEAFGWKAPAEGLASKTPACGPLGALNWTGRNPEGGAPPPLVLLWGEVAAWGGAIEPIGPVGPGPEVVP